MGVACRVLGRHDDVSTVDRLLLSASLSADHIDDDIYKLTH